MNNEKQEQFSSYRLSEGILETLELLGYKRPTKIQQEVIPVILDGNNVVAKAQTGSGKTAAFAIPICEKVTWEENAPQALILEPTRELTVQVRDEVFNIGRKKRLKVAAVFGGFPIDKQIQTLKQKTHIAVGTPGRVMDHIRRGTLKLTNIDYLVIDEADLMLDMGFIDEVKEIISLINAGCKISLFSATLESGIQQLVESHIQDVTLIIQEPQEEIINAISKSAYEVDSDNKYEVFVNVLIQENPESCIIFCGTREMVNVLFEKLRRNRIFCGKLHGDMEQRERLKTIDAFRRGCFNFLIATDVVARGIDFDSITHVINYDFPTGKETYVHRIGRTGRNGKTGKAISLVGEVDRRMLEAVENYTGETLSILECPNREELDEKTFWKSLRKNVQLKPKKGEALNSGILRLVIGGGKKSKMRAGDIVGTICSIEGVDVADIGIIDIRESISYVEILNEKGSQVLEALQTKPIKGKVRKVRITRHV